MAPAGLAATLATTSIAAMGTGTALTLLKFMTATQIKLGLSALVVAGAATALVVQHQIQNQLQADNQSLRQQIAQLQADNTSLSNRLSVVGQAKTLADEQFNELLKLRGEVGMLRRQTNEIGALREKLNSLKRSLQAPSRNILSEEQQQEMVMHKVSDARQAGLLLHMFADDNNSQFPTNFDQVVRYIGNTNFAQVFSTEFEIIYQGSLTNIANPSSAIVVQEYEAWPTYDGKWAKVYGFADGHSQLVTEPNDDFSSFEQQHSVSPVPNQ